KDGAAYTLSRVIGEGAIAYRESGGGGGSGFRKANDGAAIGGRIVKEGAVAHRGRPLSAWLTYVRNPSPFEACSIPVEGAAADYQRLRIVDTSAELSCIGGEGAVGHCQRAFVENATSIFSGGVAGEDTSVYGEGAIVRDTATIRSVAVGQGETGYGADAVVDLQDRELVRAGDRQRARARPGDRHVLRQRDRRRLRDGDRPRRCRAAQAAREADRRRYPRQRIRRGHRIAQAAVGIPARADVGVHAIRRHTVPG